MERVSRPVTDRIIERLAPRPGETILDLATGSGLVGFAAADLVGPEGRVIVSDFAGGMVAAAERRAAGLGITNAEFRVLDAERLELPDDCVDGVTCRWGYMLMSDPAAALGETRRVLRPGGRLSCAVWGTAEQNPWAALPGRVLVEHGHMQPPAPGTPGIFALGDPDRLRPLLTGAGFGDPRIEAVSFTDRYADLDDYWDFLLRAAGAIAVVLERLTDAQRADVRAGVERAAAAFRRGAELQFPAVSLVASAQ
jgi:SAM-dependent methyltransferase